MNKRSAILLSILSRCKPDDDILEKEKRIQNIINSSEYTELSRRTMFSKEMNDFFSSDKLHSYSEKQLSQLSKVIPLLPQMIEDLSYSLKNGDAPKLMEKDKPNYFDKESVERLIHKLHDSNGLNYCNIRPEEYLLIFDNSTIKSLNDDFYNLPYKCDDYNIELDKFYKGKKYCISSSEIKERELAFEREIESVKNKMSVTKSRKKGRFFTKIMLSGIAMLLPVLVYFITNLLSPLAVLISILIIFFFSLLLLIGG